MKNITLAILIAMAASASFASGELKSEENGTVVEKTEKETVTTEIPTDTK